MRQATPAYQEQDLDRVIVRDYGSYESGGVKSILGRYGQKEWQREKLRVKMACLKLADGNIQALKKWVNVAGDDYRDIIALAEYPAYMQAKTDAQKAKAIDTDWKALQIWLHRE